MARLLGGCVACSSVGAVALAAAVAALQRTVWWAAVDFQNCASCEPHIDWARAARQDVSTAERQEFASNGVAVLRGALLDQALIAELGQEGDRVPDTFLTNIVAKFLLTFYLRYEHRLETRSEIFRDWAVHGPFGRWAAQLLGAEEVRLYNTELIYHRGADSPTCNATWHRDSVAAPFDPEVPSAVFNVFLQDIDADHDGLIYVRGSHKNPSSLPADIDIIEPRIAVGDVLVHSANAYHTTSGRNCFARRSLQFRYFAAGAVLTHGPQRMAGPIPWTFAHAVGVAPHGLQLGDPLEGPWYPRVHPGPLGHEQRRVPEGQQWGVLRLFSLLREHQRLTNTTAARPPPGLIVMDGLVSDSSDWEWKKDSRIGVSMPALKKVAGFE